MGAMSWAVKEPEELDAYNALAYLLRQAKPYYIQRRSCAWKPTAAIHVSIV
jgi:hypothetical protein